MIERFEAELRGGGAAYGAFDGDALVGFGVLGHRFRGEQLDRLQVDLMYVSRAYRRQGIGTKLMEELADEARIARGVLFVHFFDGNRVRRSFLYGQRRPNRRPGG
ncbi:GNAT family N-acetyltransferase [Paenibacillus sp. JTLBN-2024]